MVDYFVAADLSRDSYVEALFSERVALLRTQGPIILRSHEWSTLTHPPTTGLLDFLDSQKLHLVLAQYRGSGSFFGTVIDNPVLASITIHNNQLSLLAALSSDDLEAERYIQHPFETLITQLQQLFPVAHPEEKNQIPFTFWVLGPQAPKRLVRSIDIHHWANVASNYPPKLSNELMTLVSAPPNGTGGQLLLWSGPAGTGKTHAIRTLAWEWRHFCKFHYIVDPDKFFGQEAAYMLQVLIDEDDTETEPETARWRLLILEDTGELLSQDAKERTGQGLARLLNVVDGIIGQGLRILVLVTTNEEINRLHPAISRPGRCASRINFTPFTSAEANAWLLAHGHDPSATTAKTLAELYAETLSHPLPIPVSVGFRP